MTSNRQVAVNLDAFFKLARELTESLAELHRQEAIDQETRRDSGPQSLWFSRATLSGDEFQKQLQTKVSTNPLAYTSPEQTGRMNRAADYRADFYSLGVVFYEQLTGRLPFTSSDELELIHQHLAKTPPAPAEIDPEIPAPLSQIVMKLLAKTPEDRYQSAAGLLGDLEDCAREWSGQGRIESFPLGRRDVPDRFLIPQKLYGREREVDELLRAFEDAGVGRATRPVLTLVAGYSGIGKTSLIKELYRPIIRQRGYFISGKFDQVARGVPFGALIQAFRELVRRLLGESEKRLGFWRARLTEALGANGGALAEVIPEIELIVGKLPPLPAAGPTEALNRFQLVLQNFVGALAQPEHPLVIFLDDLQWADSATLSLLQPLLTVSDARSLFLMGAYRDNEVDAAHPLMRTLTALESAGVGVRRMQLGPLQAPDLERLIGDALRCNPNDAAPLAGLILKKTDGNPFFVIQFLKTLREDGFLEFDHEQRRWVYRIDEISRAGVADNVVDLMTGKIQRLSPGTQQVLTLASCIGNSFDLPTLALISEQTAEAAAADLKESIDEGLILRIAEWEQMIPQSAIRNPQSYVFLHDRVQQAAYALIPEEKKRFIHLAIGRLLKERAELETGDEQLFDLVHHLNQGSDLMVETDERLELARLNLSAGRKAKSSTAYAGALDYFQAGSDLLTAEQWDSEYDLAFALHLESAECLYLCGRFDEAETAFESLLAQAKTKLDRARVYRLQIIQNENLSRYVEALADGRECLSLFGVSFPESEPERLAAVDREVAAIESLLGDRRIGSLVDLPAMTDPDMRMVMQILMTIWPSAYISGHQSLTRLISATMVRLSLEFGNAEESAYGYVTHTITVGPAREDFAAAYEFGCLALAVNERFNDARLRAKIYQQFHAHANFWRRPFASCLPLAREASRSGFENGDFTYGIYGAFTETWAAMVAAPDLAEFVRDYSPNLELFRKHNAASIVDAQRVLLNWARALMGETRGPASLSDHAFDEDRYLATYRDNPFFAVCYAVPKLQLACLFSDFEQALEAARLGREHIHHLQGTLWPAIFEFWNGLTLAAIYAEAAPDSQNVYRAELAEARRILTVLAENCPENFLCQSLLLSAETDRIAGREDAAFDSYERAIRYAAETGAIQSQALAHELYARFLLSRGNEAGARVFLAEARSGYAQWGAAAKVNQLESLFPALVGRELKTAAAGRADSLDLHSVIKASQAIAGEIELDSLLTKLIRITIENAGADRGALILEHESEAFVYADGSLESKEATLSTALPLDQFENLPLTVVNYTRRSMESVTLSDAPKDERYGNDPYFARCRPRSVMCLPVISQGRLNGVLYLENHLVEGAFTPERGLVCRMLAAQAAISLENALIYDEMKKEAGRRQQSEATLRSIMEGTAALTGGNFFASLARHLAGAIPVKIAFVTECANPEKTRARTLAFWDGKGLLDSFEYDLRQTTCEKVYQGETCFYASRLQELFPEETALVDLNAQSYIGLPIYDSNGELIGHLAVIDDQPMDEPRGLDILRIFAARAGAELERMKALAEIERLKNQLHAENIYLQEEIRGEHNFDEIVGGSLALKTVLDQIERVAPTDATVLILGETGTGKELIARAIHNRSRRSERPLVKVNCGAISSGLVESELFGHVKGAFTGALEKRTGRFELADGGTLFLDEVGELPLEAQVKLLRVLQEGEFEPVGGSKTVKVDVRIIAATNRNLEDEVKAGRFRADLFYRLNVLPLRNPSLRERREDIPQLAMFFLSRFNRKFGRHIDSIDQASMESLVNYDWPGNIRELQNLIERAVVLSNGSKLIIDRTLLPASPGPQFHIQPQITVSSSPTSAPPPPTSLEDLQRRHILNALTQAKWVIEGEHGAARLLNLHPNTLRSRLKKMGIQRPK